MVEVSSSSGDSFISPEAVLGYFSVQAGMRVAEFGSGAGHFVIALARAVGASGRVIAVDVLESALQSVKTKAEAAGLKNVDLVRADLEVVGSSKIPDQSMDLVLIANTLYQSTKRPEMLREAARVLTPSGRLVIIDWQSTGGELGPPLNLRVGAEQAQALAIGAGFALENEFSAGTWHFGLVFKLVAGN